MDINPHWPVGLLLNSPLMEKQSSFFSFTFCSTSQQISFSFLCFIFFFSSFVHSENLSLLCISSLLISTFLSLSYIHWFFSPSFDSSLTELSRCDWTRRWTYMCPSFVYLSSDCLVDNNNDKFINSFQLTEVVIPHQIKSILFINIKKQLFIYLNPPRASTKMTVARKNCTLTGWTAAAPTPSLTT